MTAVSPEWDAPHRLRKGAQPLELCAGEARVLVLTYATSITRHQDTDTDGDADGSDKKYHSVYDERWRPVATFRDSDASPKESFVYHAAGGGGYGGSSYIDQVVMRDRDDTNTWTGAADGTLEERAYYCQNWRADVVALVDFDGAATMLEWVKYSAYGVPFGMPAGDADSDGDCDASDDSIVAGWVSAPSYDVRGDVDLDGDVDGTDYSAVVGGHQAVGRGQLSATSTGNHKGYAGYEFDWERGRQYHVRHRVLDCVLGLWITRDKLVYVDGPNALQYVASGPIAARDPEGLQKCASIPLPSTHRVPTVCKGSGPSIDDAFADCAKDAINTAGLGCDLCDTGSFFKGCPQTITVLEIRSVGGGTGTVSGGTVSINMTDPEGYFIVMQKCGPCVYISPGLASPPPPPPPLRPTPQ
ncbi:MAG: hypothetical protein IPK60_20545 [Sandaracinaceae bacterium]|nr:hypothetical protein [Sandaracinaceae bacterium]